ncbi:MAG: DUF1998 domain-containing protein, partial [Clostridia bacterium]|nr:DUF1998 domain-containing protein [Clostridia bacterium]
GAGPVNLPEMEMHTTSYWVSFSDSVAAKFSQSDLQNGLLGLSNVVANAAPIYLMCDPRDIHVVYQVKSTFTHQPTLYIYDSYPGGVGFSEKLYYLHKELFKTSREMIEQCTCESGCPSCVGPLNEFSGRSNPKKLTLQLIDIVLEEVCTST